MSTNVHRATTAEGWWSVANGDCAQVSSIHAGGHWLYIREKSRSEVVERNAMLCVAHKPFTISQQFKRAGDSCGRNQYIARFKRVDVETNAQNFRFTIK